MQKRDPLSTSQLISESSILLAMGVTWTAVVIYRFNVKSIEGEWGNLLLASCGFGFGFAALYAGLRHENKLVSFAVLGLLASAFLLITLAYYSEVL